ncbi:class I SAM-dependent methyltransferase [Bosea massiliensis]|uniref:Class I SAM-dependent methyltransferase n=1 Tax=Bosea massiliensis TaxID=151419 RepID=A0ABW0NYZ5_9HYPH
MIAQTGLSTDDPIVDIGGGASVLIDRLLDRGHSAVTVLDIADAGLAVARKRLGERAALVSWIAQDVTAWQPPKDAFSIWHDRAVFHFLVEDADRVAYVRTLDRGVSVGGYVILAPFALSGPERCSGLPVRRYSAELLQAELGPRYRLIDQKLQTHVTPVGNRQDFIWCLFRKTPTSAAAEP